MELKSNFLDFPNRSSILLLSNFLMYLFVKSEYNHNHLSAIIKERGNHKTIDGSNTKNTFSFFSLYIYTSFSPYIYTYNIYNIYNIYIYIIYVVYIVTSTFKKK